MIELEDPSLFDKESALCGPYALRNAMARDFAWAKRHNGKLGLAVIRVKNPSKTVAGTVGVSLKSNRQCYDVAARIDERTFGVLLGCGSKGNSTTDVLRLLEHAASAAANAGGGDTEARTFWLKSEHRSADEWYNEAVRWG